MELNEHPHRRLNILTGEWVLVSPQRSQRPWQGKTESEPQASRPAYDPHCYLCPGNTRAGGQQNPVYAEPWWFTNDFAALHPDVTPESYQDGMLVAEAEPGTCRVLCYSPDHSKTMADFSEEELLTIIELWQSQYLELSALPWVRYVQIFENKGEMMGCSNPHPHGQIWSQYSIPELVQRKDRHQRDFFDSADAGSLLSVYIEQEIAEGLRMVWLDAHFVVLVPWWAIWPFEVLLAPRRPQAHIGLLRDDERRSFAAALSAITQAYDRLFDVSFPYSAGIHQAPTDGSEQDHWHWHMEFKPPLLRSATIRKFMVGYELFGMPQRDITPEMAAEMLRQQVTARP